MKIKALVFDVFGTLVDWRGSIAEDAQSILSPLGWNIPWDAFADAWRAQYQPSMEKIRQGSQAFCKLDELHKANLNNNIAKNSRLWIIRFQLIHWKADYISGS